MSKFGRDKWHIDIRKVFKEKNPGLYRWIPGFFFYFFEWLLCLERINRLIYENSNNTGVQFAENLVKECHVDYSFKYLEPLDPDKRYVFACNHPLGGLDAMTLAINLNEMFPSFKFIVNDILMNLKGLDKIFLPINKHGAQAKSNTQIINDAYDSSMQIIVFPSGMVSRKDHDVIKDSKWHKNFINKAIKSKRDIVPVHIIANNSSFFYNFARWRKLLGLKVNLEMLLLPREFFRFDGKRLDIVIGSPIGYNDLNKKYTRDEWSERIKKQVYSLKSE